MIRIALSAFILLAACSERSSNEAEAVETAYDNQADRIDQGAKNFVNPNMRDALEDQADAIRAEGDARADAIDDAYEANAEASEANSRAARANADKAAIGANGNVLDSGNSAR